MNKDATSVKAKILTGKLLALIDSEPTFFAVRYG